MKEWIANVFHSIEETLVFLFTNKNDSMTQIIPETKFTQVTSVEQTANGQKLYMTAKGLLGQILAADNAADSYGMFGCAESVNKVALRALGVGIGGGASTGDMYDALLNIARFKPVADPLPGDICICPTGFSTLGSNLHGHVGITGVNWFMSNDSETATWEANYTRKSWESSFAARGFHTYYFRVL